MDSTHTAPASRSRLVADQVARRLAGKGARSLHRMAPDQAPRLFVAAVALALPLGVVVAWSAPLALLAALGIGLAGCLHLVRPRVHASAAELLLHLLVLTMFVESLSVGPISIGRVFAVVAVLAVVARFLVSRAPLPEALPIRALPVLALAGLYVASGLWSDHPRAWLFALGQLGLAVGFYLAFATLPDARRAGEVVRPLLRTYVLGAVLAAGVGIAQIPVDSRAVGLQGDPNIYAMYQLAALPAAASLAWTCRSRRARIGWLLLCLPIAASVLASQSRGALVALAPVLLVSVVTMAPPRLRLRLSAAAVLGVLVMGLIAASTSARVDPTRVSDDRASGRIDIWYVAWHSFLQHPLTGLGSGSFKPDSVALLTSVPGVELTKSHLLESSGIEVHNLYLEALTERGVLGLLILLWLLGQTAYVLVRARAPDRPELDCLLPMLVAFSVAAVFLSIANNKLLWMLVGLSALLPAATNARTRPRTEEYVS